MANENLRINITDQGSAAKTAKSFQSLNNAVNTTDKRSKRSSQSMIQLSYALDDAQLGSVKASQSIRGMANNIQALAVSAGASGGLVFAITAATAAVGYFVRQMEKGQEEAENMRKALSEEQGLVAETLLYAEVLQTSTPKTDAHTLALKNLKDKGYDPATISIEDFTAAIKRQALVEASLAASKDKISKLLQEEVTSREKIRSLEKDGLTQEEAFAKDNRGNFKGGALASQYRAAHKVIEETPGKITQAIADSAAAVKNAIGTDGLLGDANLITGGEAGEDGFKDGQVYVLGFLKGVDSRKFIKGLGDASAKGFSNVFSSIGGQGFNLSNPFHQFTQELPPTLDIIGEQVDGLTTKIESALTSMTGAVKTSVGKIGSELEQLNGVFEDVLAGGITNFAQGLGTALGSGENIGKSLLKGIGTLMIAFGSALIAWGVGWEAFKSAPENPTLAIVGGAALIVAGAAIAAVAGKAGGKAPRASKSVARTYNQGLTQTQGSGGNNGRYIGELQLRGSNLVVGLQAGNETRNRQFG